MNKIELKIPPVFLLCICLAIAYLISIYFKKFDKTLVNDNIFALILFIIGITIAILGVLAFKKAKTTVDPMQIDKTSSLVIRGIYHYSRNPMYLGMALVLFSYILYLQNILGFTGLILFYLTMNRFQIIPEERILLEKFREEYLKYKNKTRRWI